MSQSNGERTFFDCILYMRRRRAITKRDSWPIILGAAIVCICGFGSDQVAEVDSAAQRGVSDVLWRVSHVEICLCCELNTHILKSLKEKHEHLSYSEADEISPRMDSV